MEFALVAVFAAALVVALGVTAFEALSRPLDAVSTVLGG
jgi:Flp pilus assembly pilin Flp